MNIATPLPNHYRGRCSSYRVVRGDFPLVLLWRGGFFFVVFFGSPDKKQERKRRKKKKKEALFPQRIISLCDCHAVVSIFSDGQDLFLELAVLGYGWRAVLSPLIIDVGKFHPKKNLQNSSRCIRRRFKGSGTGV